MLRLQSVSISTALVVTKPSEEILIQGPFKPEGETPRQNYKEGFGEHEHDANDCMGIVIF